MAKTKHNATPAALLADKMQLRTRKENNFEDIESRLPDPKALIGPAVSTLLNPVSVLSYLGSRNPLPKQISSDDVVWLFDNTAFKPSRFSSWNAEFVSAVFEREPKCSLVEMATVIAKILGLADEAVEYETIKERLLPFLWDVRPGRQPRALLQEQELKLGPTGPNGMSSDVLKLSEGQEGTYRKTAGKVPTGTIGLLKATTYFAGREGWGIVSDIDDTIKVTMTSDPTGILRETFVNEPLPIAGMPELYKTLASMLPKDTPWFYLSASPYNLYPFLRDFRNTYFPHGTIILRDASLKTISGLLTALTTGTEGYKTDRLRKINSWLPKRKMILIGDSTQSDPEAYGEMYRDYPKWVKGIFIRRAAEIEAVGIKEKNEPKRFEEAFEGVPEEVWHVFDDPKDCARIVQDILDREG